MAKEVDKIALVVAQWNRHHYNPKILLHALKIFPCFFCLEHLTCCWRCCFSSFNSSSPISSAVSWILQYPSRTDEDLLMEKPRFSAVGRVLLEPLANLWDAAEQLLLSTIPNVSPSSCCCSSSCLCCHERWVWRLASSSSSSSSFRWGIGAIGVGVTSCREKVGLEVKSVLIDLILVYAFMLSAKWICKRCAVEGGRLRERELQIWSQTHRSREKKAQGWMREKAYATAIGSQALISTRRETSLWKFLGGCMMTQRRSIVNAS